MWIENRSAGSACCPMICELRRDWLPVHRHRLISVIPVVRDARMASCHHKWAVDGAERNAYDGSQCHISDTAASHGSQPMSTVRHEQDPMVESVREQAAGLLDDAIALRRTLHEWPELGNDLPITREQVLGVARGPAARLTLHEIDERDRGAARRAASPGRRSCCAATWTRCRCRRTPASTSRRNVDGCDARLRPRHAHGDAVGRRPAAERARATTSPAGCCSCSNRARRATTAPGSCSTRACSTCRRAPTAPSRRSTRRSPCTSPRRCPSGWVSTRGGPIMASADTMIITVIGKGGHASEPHRTTRPDPGGVRDRAGAAD